MSKKILLADDSLTIQKVVELTFMDEGFEVEAVGSGGEALSRLEDAAPDLVIADVHMPGPSGYDVCREVKQRSPGTPVLLLVGTFQPFDHNEAEECGADGFLKKPFDSQELFRRVEELIQAATAPEVDEAEPPAVPVEEAAPVETMTGFRIEETPAEESADQDPGAEEERVEESATADATVAIAAPPAALSDEDVDRIARRVVEILGDDVLREVSWEVVPDLAEIVIKDRLRELESQLD